MFCLFVLIIYQIAKEKKYTKFDIKKREKNRYDSKFKAYKGVIEIVFF